MNPWPWGIVLGAALAVATTLLVEYVKFKWNESRTKRLFRTLLQIELPLILTTVDTLIKEHDKQNYFWLLTVALVPVQRQGFDRRRRRQANASQPAAAVTRYSQYNLTFLRLGIGGPRVGTCH